MQGYCTHKKLGEAHDNSHGTLAASLCLPAAVMRYRPQLNRSILGEGAWKDVDRDEAIEVIVPLSVIERLGKFMCAGQLVAVSSEYSEPVKHIARLVPAELCTAQMLSHEGSSALGIDEKTCLTSSGKEVALLSPILAFNLGLPYNLAELTHGSGTPIRSNPSSPIELFVCRSYDTAHFRLLA